MHPSSYLHGINFVSNLWYGESLYLWLPNNLHGNVHADVYRLYFYMQMIFCKVCKICYLNNCSKNTLFNMKLIQTNQTNPTSGTGVMVKTKTNLRMVNISEKMLNFLEPMAHKQQGMSSSIHIAPCYFD